MALYAVIDVTVKDREKLKEYVAGHLPTIAQYGGRILCRGFDPAVVTGDWTPQLLVIHEWPDREQFQRWFDSGEYRPWKEMREEACDMNMVLVSAPDSEAAGKLLHLEWGLNDENVKTKGTLLDMIAL